MTLSTSWFAVNCETVDLVALAIAVARTIHKNQAAWQGSRVTLQIDAGTRSEPRRPFRKSWLT